MLMSNVTTRKYFAALYFIYLTNYELVNYQLKRLKFNDKSENYEIFSKHSERACEKVFTNFNQ